MADGKTPLWRDAKSIKKIANEAVKNVYQHVSSPADDPAVTGVGGTNLVTSWTIHSLRATYVEENAFFDKFAPGQGLQRSGSIWGSGGGKSVLFSKPTYQFLVNTHASTRAVPDVAMHMGGCPVGSVTPCGPDRSSDI